MKVEHALERAVTRGIAAGTTYSMHSPLAAEGAETVVLIHGVGMDQSVWSPQIEALTTHYRVIAYDMLGHGGSALPTATPTLDDYAVQLERLLDALQIDRAHIVGHSMGALVALQFALTHPSRSLSVAALNAVYDRTPEQREAVMSRAATLDDVPLDAGIDVTLARWFGDPIPAELTKSARAVRELLLSVDPVGYARTYRLFARADDSHIGRLPKLDVPALFLTGECDANSSPAMSHAMAAAAPLGRAEIIANARHMMSITDPVRVNERLLAFLFEASKAQARASSETRVDAGRLQ
jgi:(E)-2-((N-methylformamido)methylene)succinate hydrolase